VDRKHDGRFWFTGLKSGTYRAEVTRGGHRGPLIRLGSIDVDESIGVNGTIERDLVVAP